MHGPVMNFCTAATFRQQIRSSTWARQHSPHEQLCKREDHFNVHSDDRIKNTQARIGMNTYFWNSKQSAKSCGWLWLSCDSTDARGGGSYWKGDSSGRKPVKGVLLWALAALWTITFCSCRHSESTTKIAQRKTAADSSGIRGTRAACRANLLGNIAPKNGFGFAVSVLAFLVILKILNGHFWNDHIEKQPLTKNG